MRFDEYERSGHVVYGGLAQTVVTILAAAIDRLDNLHPQQIQNRAKDSTSLKRKLERADVAADADIEPAAKDLAGARIVFYTNGDVDRFQASRVLTDNFDVDWNRTRFHHPTSDDPEPAELFVSANYVVSLKPERAVLPEYAAYSGLWCEVQVQTSLNHAWAEMAHDTLYKRPELQGFGRQLMEGIEARMKGIMRDHLAPAGYAFDLVLRDFYRLSRGQALFERDLATSIQNAEDNNALYEVLQTFSVSVLPHFDDFDAVSADILASMVEAVRRARDLPVKPRTTPFGDLLGQTVMDVIEVAAGVIGELKLMDVEDTFEIICDLYLTATSDDDRACWVGMADKLARHNLQVWEQAGPAVPVILMGQIARLDAQRRLALKPLLLAIVRCVLAVELSGSASSGPDTFVLRQGAVVASDALGTAREQAVDLLVEYDAVVSAEDLKPLVEVFQAGMSMPVPRRAVEASLAILVYADAAKIVRHFTHRVAVWPYELRQSVEHDLLWVYRHQGAAPGEGLDVAVEGPELEAARVNLVDAILAFRDLLNEDAGFTTYKLLVGFESVFPPAWTDRDFDYTSEDAYRRAEVEALVVGINDANAEEWLSIVRRCAATESNDLATFPTFGVFLERLGTERPDVVLTWLPQFDDRLANFLAPFLRGLRTTARWPDVLEILNRWRETHRFLPSLAWASGVIDALDLVFLDGVLDAGIDADNLDVVLNTIQAVGMRDPEADGARLKPIFLKAVAAAGRAEEPRWVRFWRSRRRGSATLLDLLDEREASDLLDTLVAYPKVDSALDDFLAALAARYPQVVLDYFGQRITTHFARDYGRDYEDIPYDLHDLTRALAPATVLLLKTARQWFSFQPDLFEYHGGKLIEGVHPSFGDDLHVALGSYIGTDDPDDARFVVATLRAYSGEASLQPIARDIVASLTDDDPLLDVLQIALEPSGVTSGAFGRVNRLTAHRDNILGWADDPREKVQAFARRYAHQLENSIRVERRRSEEGVAISRLEWEARGFRPNPSSAAVEEHPDAAGDTDA